MVAGADLRLSLASCAPRLFSRDSAVLIKGVPSLAHQPAHSPQRTEHSVHLSQAPYGRMLFPVVQIRKSPRRLTSGLNSVGVFISPRSFAFDVRAYMNYASSKLVFKSFLQFSLFSMPSSAINVKKTAELNNSMHQRTRSMHCFSVKKGA